MALKHLGYGSFQVYEQGYTTLSPFIGNCDGCKAEKIKPPVQMTVTKEGFFVSAICPKCGHVHNIINGLNVGILHHAGCAHNNGKPDDTLTQEDLELQLPPE